MFLPDVFTRLKPVLCYKALRAVTGIGVYS